VLPAGKVDVVRALRAGGRTVAFVGDGINDALALAEAGVGIAIGAGSDVAIESADVVLLRADLRSVPDAIALSQATMRSIRRNLVRAFACNAALIRVAAGVLWPVSGTLLCPVLAACAMARRSSPASSLPVSPIPRLSGVNVAGGLPRTRCRRRSSRSRRCRATHAEGP
jgi:Cu+-exporting ATPase